MSDTPASKKSISPDWLVQGILTKLGDTLDKLTGRGWKPSSGLATSELIERLKALLDAEAETSEDGRGKFVPHNIKLKMQWDKFSADSDKTLQKLENELLTAAVDHINDKRYFTHKPLSVEARPDYFTSGVKLLVSFERFNDDDDEASVNLLHSTDQVAVSDGAAETVADTYRFHFLELDKSRTVELTFEAGKRKSVGRTKENDIFIDDPSVSKLHASLALNGDGHLAVADTGSTNGTFINGRRIAYGKAEVVADTDTLAFGSVDIRIEHLPKPEPAITAESTAAATVAIGDFEFSSKPAEALAATETDLRETGNQMDSSFHGNEAGSKE